MAKPTILPAILAAALALGAPAMAQQSQLEMQALSDMRRLGLPTEGVSLTQSQAAAIVSISNDPLESRNDRRAAVQVVLRRGR
jgi:hypothetical protein